MMAKKGSNRNIYIFWGLIALVVIIVLLVIFLPHTNTVRPYNNMYQVSLSIKKVDSHEKNITYYAEQFIVNHNLSIAQKQKTQALLHLQQSLEYSTNYALTGLQFVETKKDFSNLSNKQNEYFNQVQTSITQLLDYCQNYTYRWFDGSTTENETYFKQIYSVYIQRYQDSIKQLSNFYTTTAELLTANAIQGIEITQTNLEKNQEFMNQIKEQANLDTPNATICSTIWSNVQTYYYQFN